MSEKAEPAIKREFVELNRRMDEIGSELKAIGTAVKGDPALGQLGIIPRLENIEGRLGKIDEKRNEQAQRESFEMGKHAIISAGISVIVAGIIAFTAAFIGRQPAQAAAPVYYVLSSGQASQNPIGPNANVPAAAMPQTVRTR